MVHVMLRFMVMFGKTFGKKNSARRARLAKRDHEPEHYVHRSVDLISPLAFQTAQRKVVSREEKEDIVRARVSAARKANDIFVVV